MKILIVDDDSVIQSLFNQFFKAEIKAGVIEFFYVFSAEEALTYLSSNLHEVVLILSDISLPGMNGLELLKQIKGQYPQLVVFTITAYGDEANYKRACSYGTDGFITKPLDFQVLKKKLLDFVAQFEQDKKTPHSPNEASEL